MGARFPTRCRIGTEIDSPREVREARQEDPVGYFHTTQMFGESVLTQAFRTLRNS